MNVLELALKALMQPGNTTLWHQAVHALRNELEKEQEPVAWQWLNTAFFRKKLPANAEPGAWNPLYPAPLHREWQGLTADDVWASDKIMAANASLGLRIEQMMDLIRAVEAKLKEKNSF